MKRKWKNILIVLLLMLPIVVFFSGCNQESESVKRKEYYKVIFYTNSTDTVEIDSQVVLEGSTIFEPDEPIKKGYSFDGWYTDNTFQRLWNFDLDVVTNNITLVAKWNKLNYD